MKRIIFYEDLKQRCYVPEWLSDLYKKDKAAFNLVMVRLLRLHNGNLGDCKSLRGGLYELRFRNGLRIYYTNTEKETVVLFYGGGKKSQTADIAKARQLLKELETADDVSARLEKLAERAFPNLLEEIIRGNKK